LNAEIPNNLEELIYDTIKPVNGKTAEKNLDDIVKDLKFQKVEVESDVVFTVLSRFISEGLAQRTANTSKDGDSSAYVGLPLLIDDETSGPGLATPQA